jgi:hypothetical protein
MSKRTNPTWELTHDLAVTRDKHNWIVLRKSGGRWRGESFYPTPQMLLKDLHQQITRSMPAETDLLEHLETAYKTGERLSDKLSDHVLASFGELAKLTPQRAAAILKVEEKIYVS